MLIECMDRVGGWSMLIGHFQGVILPREEPLSALGVHNRSVDMSR